MCQVQSNKDRESDKKILIEHLRIRKVLVIGLEQAHSSELNEWEENHHAEDMEVSCQPSPTNSQTVEYSHKRLGLSMKATQQRRLIPF